MSDIKNLRAVDTLSSGDLVAVYSTTNGGTRKAPASAFVQAIGDSYVDQAEAQADAATATVSAFQNLVYPGVYAVDPTTRPNGSAMQEGDRAVVLVGGLPTEKLRSGGAWIVPNVGAANLAASSGSSLVGFIQAGAGAVPRTQQTKDRDTASVQDFGATGLGVADDAPKFQAAIDAYTSGVDVLVPPGTYRLNSQVTVNSDVRLVLFSGATIVHGADVKLFRMKPRSAFLGGGTVDVTSTGFATFTQTVFEFDGTDSPNFAGASPTRVEARMLGRRGAGTGTAFHLHSTGATSKIYGVQVEANIDGFQTGVLMEQDGGTALRWVNGNRFDLRAAATVNLFKQVTSTPGVNLDGNVVNFDYQYIAPHSALAFDIVGRNNDIEGMLWDYPGGVPAVAFSAASTTNRLVCNGVDDTNLSDLGIVNSIWQVNAPRPGLKINRLMQNSTATLLVEGNDVRMSNAKSLQWVDNVAATQTVLQLSAANNTSLNSGTGGAVLINSGSNAQVLINAAQKLIVDHTATANETSMRVWDANSSTMKRVTVGVADSGGVGFRLLRIPN